MRFPRTLIPILGALLGTAGAAPAVAQDFDLAAVLSNDGFYAEHDILRARGDVPFVADTWLLPGPADSVAVLLGVSLSNEALQFVRTSEGQWQASYEVVAAFEADGDGTSPPDQRWQKSVQVAAFDETLLSGETIIFQTETLILPGGYELELTVRDLNAEDASSASADIEATPFPAGTPTLTEPVLLRVHQTGVAGDGDFIVNPSHSYATAPSEVEFLVELSGAPAAQPYVLTASLIPLEGDEDDGARAITAWSDTVRAASSGPTEVFGTITGTDARFGEHRLVVELTDDSGRVVTSTTTPVLIAGSGGWIAENWEDALTLIRYEATGDEMDILEDVEGDEQRIEAWNCFWRVRDPVASTSANEAMTEYFRQIQIANNQWRSSLRPGYLSDRGRVFVTLGPPDEITQRPVPSAAEPFEVWTYHRYNFEILFVDRIGFNNYQIENMGTYQRELASIERRKLQFLRERAGQCPLLAPAFE